MKSCEIYVPATVTKPVNNAVPLNIFYKNLLELGLQSGLDEDDDIEDMASLTFTKKKVDLGDATFEKLFGLAGSAENIGLTSYRLLNNAYHTNTVQEVKRQDRVNELNFHPLQQRIYENFTGIMKSQDKPYGLVEGSTGIGKGRGLCMAAIDRAKTSVGPVVMIAPTIENVGQLYSEFKAISADHRAGVKAAIMPGKTEFIDVSALESFLNSADMDDFDDLSDSAIDRTVIREWIKNGGSSDYSSALKEAMSDAGIELFWLAGDLKSICPDFDADNYTMSSTENDESLAKDIMERYRAFAKDANIIICTHAMMATNIRLGYKIFPAPDFLFVDEAHLLEQTFSSVFSSNLALSTLRREMHKAYRLGVTKAKSVFGAARKLQKFLGMLNLEENNNIRLHYADHSDFTKITSIVGDLISIQNAMKKGPLADYMKSSPSLERLLRTIEDSVRSITNDIGRSQSGTPGADRLSLMITYSPSYLFPTIVAVSSNTYNSFKGLWGKVNGAILTSATIFTNDQYGNRSCMYIKRNLALFDDMVQTPEPVIANYITETPTLHVSNKRDQGVHRYPSNPIYSAKFKHASKDEQLEMVEIYENAIDGWYSSMADTIANRIKPKAKGGIMVLLNSYDDIEGIYQKLVDRLGEEKVIATSKNRNITFAMAKRAFISSYEAGQHSILLALGQAWTGVSFLDTKKEAAEDNLLTDIVIARMPLNMNRSEVMIRRISGHNFKPIVEEALITLKQGFGRLIRRSGLKDRHIWFLDNRIHEQSAQGVIGPLAGAVRHMIKAYPHREYI